MGISTTGAAQSAPTYKPGDLVVAVKPIESSTGEWRYWSVKAGTVGRVVSPPFGYVAPQSGQQLVDWGTGITRTWFVPPGPVYVPENNIAPATLETIADAKGERP